MDGLRTVKIVISGLVIFTLIYTNGPGFHLSALKLIAFVTIVKLGSSINYILSFCIYYVEFDENLLEYLTPWMESLKTVTLYCGVDLSSVTMNRCIPAIQIVAILSLLMGSRRHILQKTLPEFLVALWITEIFDISIKLQNEILYVWISLLTSVAITAIMLIIHSQWDHWKMIISIFLVMITGSALAALIASSDPENHMMISKSLQLLYNDEATVHKGVTDIDTLTHLEWDDYDSNCHRQAWKTRTPAFTQLFCSTKYGNVPTAVRWRGRVSVVKVREMSTSAIRDVAFDIIVNLMPSETSSESGHSWQQYLSGGEHHQQSPSPAMLLISTADIMKHDMKQKAIDLIVSLRPGDKIEFHGVLNPAAVGGLRPEIDNLQSIKCLECNSFHVEEFFFRNKNLQKTLHHSDGKKFNESNYSSFLSAINQLKNFFIELIDTVKSKSNITAFTF